jgi:hypothetical protein
MAPFPPVEPFVLDEKPASVPVEQPVQEEKPAGEPEEIAPIKSEKTKKKKG